MKGLLDQGWIKMTNFKNSMNKLAYAYLLTPSGIDANTASRPGSSNARLQSTRP